MPARTVDLVVTDARVVTPTGTRHGGVAVDEGQIVDIGPTATLPAAERTLDAAGNFLLPGFIDPHVHLGRRDRGYPEQLEIDFETETRGAVFGGVTCLLNFVEHADPYLPDLDRFRQVGEAHSYIDFSHHFVMSHGHHLDEVTGLAEAGAPSFKMFFNMYKYTDIDIEPCEADRVVEVLEQVARLPGAIGMFHAENAEVQRLAERRVRAAGRSELAAWADASPPVAEAMQIDQIGRLTEFTGARSYVVHVSTPEGIDAIRRYRDRGVQVFGETLVTFLACTTDDDTGVWGKVSPPIRDERTRQALWAGLRTGALQHVGTDHIATSKERKECGEGQHGDHLWDSPPGVQPGLEYLLPMMMTEGYHRNRLGIERIVEVCSTNNARRFGLYPRKGVIAPGSDADLVVVDPDATATVDDDFFHTREPRWSPVHGREVRGLATHTVVGGDLVVEDRELVGEPGGREFIAR